MIKKSLTAIAFVFTALWANTTIANDDVDIYGAAPPPDAVFLRFIDTDNAETVNAFGYDFELKDLDPEAYVAISASALEGATADDYYTVKFVAGSDPVIAKEGARTNPRKVYLFLNNFGAQDVELKLADGSAQLMPAVKSGTSHTLAVNPVKASVGVFPVGSDEPIEIFDLSLRRGQDMTFMATDNGVRMIENKYGAVLTQ